MSVAKSILNQPLDEDLLNELAHALAGPQEDMTQKVGETLSLMAPLEVGYVVMMVNVVTGVHTITSNLDKNILASSLRCIAEHLEEGKL